MKKIISIVGARPQFIKHAPMQLELQKKFQAKTIHTGQHYDANMSDIFFKELKIPAPDHLFDMEGSKKQGEQTGIMMTRIEEVCYSEKPDGLLVYGDTNSTLAGALVAAKMHIPLIHIEAGLRSYNREMPEEVNRIVADEFSSLLFCPTPQAIENLRKEGISHNKIFLCGDVMCDMMELVRPAVKRMVDFPYYFATIHRPYNTDDRERFIKIVTALDTLDKKVVFAIHPRTIARMKEYGISQSAYPTICFIPAVGYLESLSYQSFADCIITDSGGVQKEAYMLQKKCITLRSETEWTETLEGGWNTLVFEDLSVLQSAINGIPGTYHSNLYGDGRASKEITGLIEKNL